MKMLEEGLVLYHGSYCIVENPDLAKCELNKDFGRGFYLTTSKEQARSFAKISAKKAMGKCMIPFSQKFAYVSFYKLSDIKGLRIFNFESADVSWLHCIVAHRRKGSFSDIAEKMKDFDIISGKIANDDTNTTIAAYMANLYGQMGSERADSFCISLLLPDRLKDQFCFRSEQALSRISFLKSEKVSLE